MEMSLIRAVTRYVKWYHIVGLLLGVTVLTGLIWWLIERDRGASFRYNDETDLVERN